MYTSKFIDLLLQTLATTGKRDEQWTKIEREKLGYEGIEKIRLSM